MARDRDGLGDTLGSVAEPASSRRIPFAAAAVVLLLVCVVVARLPDPFVIALEENSPLESSSQAGWAFRLIALVAVAQALYGGFALLRVDRVEAARERDPGVSRMPATRLIRGLARTAAVMPVLTLLYGIAALWATGLRGGFWLFPTIALLQGAWYYRQVGEIARWLSFQPKARTEGPHAAWVPAPPGYWPPLARGMKDPPGAEPAGSKLSGA
jgi:hypothetical protein